MIRVKVVKLSVIDHKLWSITNCVRKVTSSFYNYMILWVRKSTTVERIVSKDDLATTLYFLIESVEDVFHIADISPSCSFRDTPFVAFYSFWAELNLAILDSHRNHL